MTIFFLEISKFTFLKLCKRVIMMCENIAPNLFFDNDVILITIIDMSKALFLRRIKNKTNLIFGN